MKRTQWDLGMLKSRNRRDIVVLEGGRSFKRSSMMISSQKTNIRPWKMKRRRREQEKEEGSNDSTNIK